MRATVPRAWGKHPIEVGALILLLTMGFSRSAESEFVRSTSPMIDRTVETTHCLS
jgi:hypothetical protein